MRALLQRVKRGSVSVEGTEISRIAKGFVILLGIKKGDTLDDAKYLAGKCAGLRVFEDEAGKMNISFRDAGGEALVVSQFTLYGDARRGNRPGFTDAAPPDEAEPLYRSFVEMMKDEVGADKVFTGKFGAMMDVTIVNDGPVTLLLESPGG